MKVHYGKPNTRIICTADMLEDMKECINYSPLGANYMDSEKCKYLRACLTCRCCTFEKIETCEAG